MPLDRIPVLLDPPKSALLICTSKGGCYGIGYLQSEGDFKTVLAEHCARFGGVHLDRIYVSFPGDPFWDKIHSPESYWYAPFAPVPGELGQFKNEALPNLGDELGTAMREKAKKVLLPSHAHKALKAGFKDG